MAEAPPAPLTWIVGAGGLLGRRVVARAPGPLFHAPRIPWQARSAADVLAAAAHDLKREASDAGTPWQVLWCAGSGMTSSSAEALEQEVRLFDALLDALDAAPQGAVFLASSVGGVYAGNPNPPYSEASAPVPLAPYGRTKLRMEEAVHEWARRTGCQALIGRIANLYGPGQNLDKPQGLVSQVCANYLRRRPTSIWVSQDTLRDYLYVEDCADLIHDSMDRLRLEGGSATKILGSGQSVTISAIIGEVKRVIGRKPDVLFARSANARFQVPDLSVRSIQWPDLDDRDHTPLGVGIARTIADLRLTMQHAS